MRRMGSPYLLDWFLRLLLSPRDRETVSGDLQEEFFEVKVPELGSFRARLWYLRQVLSFVPARTVAVLQPVLRLLSLCTALAGVWLGMMDVVLRHPGYGSQVVIAAMIVSQALLTLAALRFDRSGGLRATATAGSLIVLWIAGRALIAALRGPHFEGYILLISSALMVQATLALLTLPGRKGQAISVHDDL
ncbi:MAG TPA: permease prefix domain 2-containing transporter [Acidobacteriaceae bacterium]|nr:permease prefix domain 2-containing transporter [Acidobacteriaceae bacterium]